MRRPLRHVTRACFLTATLASLFIASVAVAATPRPVLSSPLDEKQPAATAVYLAWAQNSRTEPGHFNVFVRRGSQWKHRVNPPGTSALMGGVDGHTLAYQLITGNHSHVALYDVRSRSHIGVPRALSGRSWDWDPTIWGRYSNR